MSQFKVEVNYVTSVSTVTQTEHAFQMPVDDSFQLVDQDMFCQLFSRKHPGSHIDVAINCWQQLFGIAFMQSFSSSGTDIKESRNPNYHYLSRSACDKILEFKHLFVSGIDFEHLPRGFFRAKNPNIGGVCDVLHYSAFVDEHDTTHRPLAMVLSYKSREGIAPIERPEPEAAWYRYLNSKRAGSGGTIYCTEQELHEAFTAFTATLERLGLRYFEVDWFRNYQQDLNPIVLLGRFETVLTQRHLKPADLLEQWHALPKLYLDKGRNAIRAITDFDNEERPCGFLIQEMECHSDIEHSSAWEHFDQNQGYRMFDEPNHINSSQPDSLWRFWRYIAYQPNRYSIAFYREALRHLSPQLTIPDTHRLIDILADSTTRTNGEALTADEERQHLAMWAQMVHSIVHIEDKLPTTLLRPLGYRPGAFRANIIRELHQFPVRPNLNFYSAIMQYVEQYLSRGFGAIKNIFNEELATLSARASALLRDYHEAVYQGERFYFQGTEWLHLDIKQYIDLLWNLPNHLKPYIIAYVSTFNIKNTEDVALLTDFNVNQTDLVRFGLELFKEVESNHGLTSRDLADLMRFCNVANEDNPHLQILLYVEEHHRRRFSEHFFEEKRADLDIRGIDINPHQRERLHECRFSADQENNIARLQALMLANNPRNAFENTQSLNGAFMTLRNVLLGDDFTALTERLANMGLWIGCDIESLLQLLRLIIQKRSLEGFNQIYFRYLLENSQDPHLGRKFVTFINDAKPLTLELGTMRANRIAMEEMMASLILNSDGESLDERLYAQFLASAEAIISLHPHIQYYFFECFNHVPGKYSHDFNENVRMYLDSFDFLAHILNTAENASENKMVIFTLFSRFHEEPNELHQIVSLVRLHAQTIEQQRFLFVLITHLLSTHQSIEALERFVIKLERNPLLYAEIQPICEKAPLPSLDQLNAWIDAGNVEANYVDFCNLPFGQRRLDFAFSLAKFRQQKSLFAGVQEDLFDDALGVQFNQRLTELRGKTIIELRALFDAAKAPEANSFELLCVLIEFLARTTPQLSGNPPVLISQELNTTQVMALYAMLMNGSHKLVSEIDTGEGKSRIMMVLAAFQAARGKTVDFMTSDMSLAERDYLQYKQFFVSLGIRSSLISLDTPKELYQMGGVNFSDNSQLLLVRNKSDIDDRQNAYLDPMADNRVLLMDEVDKFQHDKSKDSFNYAIESRKLSHFLFVYPLLEQFARTLANPTPAVNEDMVNGFIQYVQRRDTNPTHLANLAELHASTPEQLKVWLRSAITAREMNLDAAYAVTSDAETELFPIRDVDGHTRYTRKVLVKDNGRPAPGSTFSDGAQQCLCAKENLRVGMEDAFIIQPEHETVRASYPIAFIQYYNDGKLFGVSGTTRSAGPRQNNEVNHEGIDYLIVPREKKLQLTEHPTWLAADEAQQIHFLKRMIRDQHAKGLPTLLICRDDNQSRKIYEAFRQDPAFFDLFQEVKHVHALTPKEDELAAIEHAGRPSHLTISTAGMFGRGVDIHSDNLQVLSSYVPTLEDEKQIKGRTARAGKPGVFRMILNMIDLDAPIQRRTCHVENEVDKRQQLEALNAVQREEVSKIYGLFLEDVHQSFLSNLRAQNEIDRLQFLEDWKLYLDSLQKDWTQVSDVLLEAIKGSNHDAFIQGFAAFTDKWRRAAPVSLATPEKVEHIYQSLIAQKGFFAHQPKPIQVRREYDPSDDGQTRIYDSFFAQELAVLKGDRPLFADFRAWREGRGALCPDLEALLKGERPLFATLRACIQRLINALIEFVSPRNEQENDAPIEVLPALA